MHQLPISDYQVMSTEAPNCAQLLATGQRELAAFLFAVTGLFGSAQARVAAEDWLESVSLIDCQSREPGLEWRRVTMAAAVRLLDHMKAIEDVQDGVQHANTFPNSLVSGAEIGGIGDSSPSTA